ncbi:hypothetical protein Sjap_021731 [Stephania japonica]|uniref:Uncharacterized protein n=1 Tax=Stephania japonica TaxID=461633 RepID=A0AAP0EWB7_9MAGN
MDGRSTIPLERRDKFGIVIRSPQATVSLEDRLTTQEVRMTKVLEYYGTRAPRFRNGRITHDRAIGDDFTGGYMREMIDEGFASTKSGGRVLERDCRARYTEVRDEGDRFVRRETINRVDGIGIQGDERGDEGHVVYIRTRFVEQHERQRKIRRRPDRGRRRLSRGRDPSEKAGGRRESANVIDVDERGHPSVVCQTPSAACRVSKRRRRQTSCK